MADPNKTKSDDHSGEHEAVVSEASVGITGNARDLAIVSSSGNRVRQDREERKRRREKKAKEEEEKDRQSKEERK